MSVYYNEWEPYPSEWLRTLIVMGELPYGVVDETDIRKLDANSLREYKQAHFFAGIGGWPLALQLAGWPEDREVWTGSCPCQPFSVAGKQKGNADDRHLWPAWFELIKKHRPATIFGEQVSGAIAHGWLDDVYKGLEGEGYAVGSAILPACSVGAPHKRDRLWFVGNAVEPTCKRTSRSVSRTEKKECSARKKDGYRSKRFEYASSSSGERVMAHPDDPRSQRWNGKELSECAGEQLVGSSRSSVANSGRFGGSVGREAGKLVAAPRDCKAGSKERQRYGNAIDDSCTTLADTASGSEQRSGTQRDERRLQETVLREGRYSHDWNIEPDVGRVANGIPARSHKLRAYGNAIVPQVAAEFIKAFLEAEKDLS